jgi:CubicO group peptidase (beta-lactamase class C family)
MNHARAFLCLVVGMILGGCSRAETPPGLRSTLESIRRKYELPALAGAIVTSQGLVAAEVVGVRKYGKDTPATINDQFHLGSDTKAMTATLLAMEVEAGKLKWDATLQKIFPEFGDMNPSYRSVTIEQMLAHRAGFTDDTPPKGKSLMDLHRLPGTPREQRQWYVRTILAEPPEYEPGQKYLYSNRSYVLAGAILEKLAGDSWENLMQKRLFDPLGMTSCGFGAMGTPGKIDQPWQHIVNDLGRRAIEPGPLSDNPEVIGPAGTVHCSIGDWAKFITAHLKGEQGKAGILKPDTFKKLHTAPYGDYGFGWLMVERSWAGGIALTHTGSNTMNYAVVWMAPSRDFAVLVMTNQAGADTFNACDETAAALIGFAQKRQ